MVKELLKRGASVNLPSSLGFTALKEAATYGHLYILLAEDGRHAGEQGAHP